MQRRVPVTLAEVFGDAWASFRRQLGAHIRWNLAFFAALLVSLCLLSCVLVGLGVGFGAAEDGGGGAESSPRYSTSMIIFLIVFYLAVLLVVFVLSALHGGVTVEITAADLRGEISAGATGRAMDRLPALAGALFLRVGADLVGLAVPITLVVARLVVDPLGAEDQTLFAVVLVLGAYPAGMGWMLVTRTFFGLSGACAQVEGLGALASMRRSVELLAGRRLQFLGLRVLWGVIAFGLYVAAYLPLLGIVFAAGRAPLLNVLLLPYMLAFYAFALLLYSFDSVLEGAYHARLLRGPRAEDLADVFA